MYTVVYIRYIRKHYRWGIKHVLYSVWQSFSGLSKTPSTYVVASTSPLSHISKTVEFIRTITALTATSALSNQSVTRLSVHPSIYNSQTVNQTLVHPTFTVNQTRYLSNSSTAPLNVSATALQNISTTDLVYTPSIHPSSTTGSRLLLESSVNQGKNWTFGSDFRHNYT